MTATLLAGVALGISYGLLGLAVTTVARSTRTLHLAIGPVLVVGVLTDLYLGFFGVPRPLTVVAGMVVAAVLSALLEPLVLRPLAGRGGVADARPVLRWLVGLAVAGAVVEVAASRWLATRQFRPDPLVATGDVAVAGLSIPAGLANAIVLGAVLAALVGAALARTGWGRRLRLVGASPRAAELGGVSPRRTRLGALAVSGAVATAAGVLVAPVTFVGVGQGAAYTVRGVAAALLFGAARASPAAVLAAGLVLGAAEAAGQAVLPRAGGEAAVAIAILAVALWRGPRLRRAWGRVW